MIRVAVTGSEGFVGTHVVLHMQAAGGFHVMPVMRRDMESAATLRERVAQAEIVVHLAGANRGPDADVSAVNVNLARMVGEACGDRPVIFATSTQRGNGTAYGESKIEAEAILDEACADRGGWLLSVILPNVFGPGSKPHYNSAVATFCHQLARGDTPTVTGDSGFELTWVVDVAKKIADLAATEDRESSLVPVQGYRTNAPELISTLRRMSDDHFVEGNVPAVDGHFEANLYRTLVSFAPPERWARSAELHVDERGALFEVARQRWAGGQTFYSTSQPGVKRGEHYHTRKFEKFCVVSGRGVIRLRSLFTGEVTAFHVEGERPVVIDIPVFHVHHLENDGDTDLHALFWASEAFDVGDPDTIYQPV